MSLSLRAERSAIDYAGHFLAFLDPSVMETTGIQTEDVIELRNIFGRRVLARVGQPLADDRGKGLVRIDQYLRQGLKVRVGQELWIEKVPQVEAVRNAKLLPAVDVTLAHDLEHHIKDQFIDNRALISVGSVLYANFPHSSAGTVYTVVELEDGPGMVTEETEIEVDLSATPHAEPPQEVTFEDVGGLDREIHLLRELIEVPLQFPHAYRQLGIRPPRGLLFYGPPGSGKTHLARAVANEIDARFYYINGPDIIGTIYGESESNLRRIFGEAIHHAPSIIFVDELDAIAPKRGESGSQSDTRLTTQFLALMDGLKRVDGVLIIGTTNRIDTIDVAFRRPGRFDRELFIGPPDKAGRLQILQVHTREMPLSHAAMDHLDAVAAATHGCVGADLMELCREAGLNTLRRSLKGRTHELRSVELAPQQLVVEKEDFDLALPKAKPSAMREAVVSIPDVSWDDVGGLEPVKRQLKELVEMPLLHPEVFAAINLRPASGILLYGPPGTGKTLLAKAIASECQANFIAVKGPEIFSKWLGESEQGIRHVFSVARQVAPSVLFFDQLDAIAPVRGTDEGTKTTERVVSQLLAEMDGVEALSKVVVIGATNRLEALDTAMLRPGRFGMHVLVPLPTCEEREAIFRIQLRNMPLDRAAIADEIAEDMARCTEGFSGAEIDALCQEAKMCALREADFARTAPLSMSHFEQALHGITASRLLYAAETSL
ncbi:MAG: AAA family ATPase [Chloroflexi bacterium]|nr:AAA family ATPase [Chloroflexota bacterium]